MNVGISKMRNQKLNKKSKSREKFRYQCKNSQCSIFEHYCQFPRNSRNCLEVQKQQVNHNNIPSVQHTITGCLLSEYPQMFQQKLFRLRKAYCFLDIRIFGLCENFNKIYIKYKKVPQLVAKRVGVLNNIIDYYTNIEYDIDFDMSKIDSDKQFLSIANLRFVV